MSLLAQHKKTVDGLDFTITTLSLGEARKIFFKLQGVFQVHSVNDGTSGLDPSMLSALTSNLREEDLEACITAFAPCTQVQEGDLIFFLKDKVALERIFAGKIDLMFAWVTACIEVNFESVLVKMRAVAKKDQEAKAAARAQSQSTSPRG